MHKTLKENFHATNNTLSKAQVHKKIAGIRMSPPEMKPGSILGIGLHFKTSQCCSIKKHIFSYCSFARAHTFPGEPSPPPKSMRGYVQKTHHNAHIVCVSDEDIDSLVNFMDFLCCSTTVPSASRIQIFNVVATSLCVGKCTFLIRATDKALHEKGSSGSDDIGSFSDMEHGKRKGTAQMIKLANLEVKVHTIENELLAQKEKTKELELQVMKLTEFMNQLVNKQ